MTAKQHFQVSKLVHFMFYLAIGQQVFQIAAGIRTQVLDFFLKKELKTSLILNKIQHLKKDKEVIHFSKYIGRVILSVYFSDLMDLKDACCLWENEHMPVTLTSENMWCMEAGLAKRTRLFWNIGGVEQCRCSCVWNQKLGKMGSYVLVIVGQKIVETLKLNIPGFCLY